jgi:SAM-dependent methyltransferase
VLRDHFAGDVASRYDETLGEMGSPEVLEPTVDLLADLAGTGAALEMAVGTGRIALPLAARGVPVTGIELSPDMVAQLRAKPGGDAIAVTVGDMTTTRVEGAFRLVYLIYNTIGNVETQARQVACFENAAAHLEPSGFFLIEMVVPDLRRLVPGHDAVVFAHAPGYVGYDRYDDLVAQHAVSHLDHRFADDSSEDGAGNKLVVSSLWKRLWTTSAGSSCPSPCGTGSG